MTDGCLLFIPFLTGLYDAHQNIVMDKQQAQYGFNSIVRIIFPSQSMSSSESLPGPLDGGVFRNNHYEMGRFSFNLKMRCLLASFLIPLIANASRPYVSLEQIIQQTPIIFEAKVLEFKSVIAPNKEMYFTYDDTAMEVSLHVSKSWKGNQKGKVMAYTWAHGKAPCTGIEIAKSENYLIYAEWDKSKEHLMFDFCRGFRPTKAKYVEEDIAILKRLYN